MPRLCSECEKRPAQIKRGGWHGNGAGGRIKLQHDLCRQCWEAGNESRKQKIKAANIHGIIISQGA